MGKKYISCWYFLQYPISSYEGISISICHSLSWNYSSIENYRNHHWKCPHILFQNAAQLLYELPIAAEGNSMTKCWKMEQMLVEHIPCVVKTDRVYCRIFIVIMVAQKVIGIPYFHQIWLVKMIDIAVITHLGLLVFPTYRYFRVLAFTVGNFTNSLLTVYQQEFAVQTVSCIPYQKPYR